MSDEERTTTAEERPAGLPCPLCGYELTAEEVTACHPTCPMAAGCSMTRCPRCGSEFPRPGPVTRWLERLLRSK
jgi:hypothetical protein